MIMTFNYWIEFFSADEADRAITAIEDHFDSLEMTGRIFDIYYLPEDNSIEFATQETFVEALTVIKKAGFDSYRSALI